MLYIVNAVRKKKLTIDSSILWIIAAVLILILGIFPNIIIWLSNLVGISYAPSLLFLLAISFLLLIILNNSLILSELKEKTKELIQVNALLEARVRETEKELSELKKKESSK